VRAARIGLPAGIALAEDYAAEGPELEADPELLKQAILNLIKNAAEAVADTGTITLRTRVVVGRRPSVVIEVLDDGPGIPAEHLDRIASPFFTTKARGTGLGLAIAAGIAEAHGGALRLENADPHGVRANLSLPRWRATEGGGGHG
jgi:signal transduction histidine kinase